MVRTRQDILRMDVAVTHSDAVHAIKALEQVHDLQVRGLLHQTESLVSVVGLPVIWKMRGIKTAPRPWNALARAAFGTE